MKLKDLFSKRAKMPPGVAQGRAASAPSKQAAPLQKGTGVLILLPLSEDGARNLAFGLTWKPLVSFDAKTVQDSARKLSATHVVNGGSVLGLGRLLTKTKAEYYAAAMVAGHAHRSAAIYALSLGGGSVWLAQTRGAGVPTGEDGIYSEIAALERVRAWRAENPTAELYSDLLNTGWDDVKTWGIAELASCAMTPNSALKPVGTGSTIGRMWSDLPGSVKVVGALAIAGMLGSIAWDEWQKYQNVQRLAKARALGLSEDAQALWQQSLLKEAAARAAPSGASWEMLRASLGRVPTKWENWPLKTAICTAGVFAGDKVVWQCDAIYYLPDASTGKPVATNAQLLKSVPTGFEARFVPTKQASLHWSASVTASPLDIKGLVARQDHTISTASRVQTFFPNLATPPTFSFIAIKVTAPVRPDGTAIAPPAGLKLPTQSPITLSSPLRAMDKLLSSGIAADWKKITLSYASNTQPNDKTSPHMVEITGVMYAAD